MTGELTTEFVGRNLLKSVATVRLATVVLPALPLDTVNGIDLKALVLRIVDIRDGGTQMDPDPDYDMSDEMEYGIAAFAWLLRGNYPPPYYGSD